MIDSVMTPKELENIRKEGLKVLLERLGPIGMVKFLQLYSDGEGDYTKEREELLKDFNEEDLKKYLDNK